MFGRPHQSGRLLASARPKICSRCRSLGAEPYMSNYRASARSASSAGKVSTRRGGHIFGVETGLDLRSRLGLNKISTLSKDVYGSRMLTTASSPRPTAAARRSATPASKGAKPPSRSTAPRLPGSISKDEPGAEPDQWYMQKKALKKKFGESGWQPRKKISPDEMETVRDLHKSDPLQFSTEKLSQMFEVSPEAVRRILKSKWRPTEAQEVERQERWEKRGEIIWASLAEKGKKPPKKWRAKGIGLTDWEKKAAHRERLKLLGFDVPKIEARPEQDLPVWKRRASKKQLPWDMDSLKLLKDSEEDYGPSLLDDSFTNTKSR